MICQSDALGGGNLRSAREALCLKHLWEKKCMLQPVNSFLIQAWWLSAKTLAALLDSSAGMSFTYQFSAP